MRAAIHTAIATIITFSVSEAQRHLAAATDACAFEFALLDVDRFGDPRAKPSTSTG
jgi:hypothetical protein